jgi:AraC-like DNA-binding protein/Tfp pilus assembly protein PilF
MKKLFLALAFFTVIACSAQNKKLDSLYLALENNPKRDTSRVKIIIEITRREFFRDRDKALSLSIEALEIAKKENFIKGSLRVCAFLCTYYESVSNFEKVAEYAYQIIDICEKNNTHYKLSEAYTLLGTLHQELKEYEKARTNYEKALVLYLKFGNKRSIAVGYHNLGLLSGLMKKYDQALDYYAKALALDLEINDLRGIYSSYIGLGSVSINAKNNANAIAYYTKALKTAKQLSSKYASSSIHNDEDALSIIYLGLSEAYFNNHQYDKSLLYADTSLAYAKNSGDKVQLKDAYEALGDIQKTRNNFQTALSYHELATVYKDSIFNDDKLKQIANLEIKYETEKKEQTIQILERDKKIQSVWKSALLVGLALVIYVSSSVILLLRYRVKKSRELFDLKIDFLIAENKELSRKYRNSSADSGNSITFEPHDQQILKKAFEIVENNIADSLFGVEKMAEEIGMSRASLHRKLKSITGFPPSDFIRNVRLKRAAALLSSQADSVAQIGFAVGFEDQSYFSKSFKKQFGVSPSEYVASINASN